MQADGGGDDGAGVEESSGLRVDGDDGELVRTWTMAKPGADRVSAIAAEEQLVRTLTLKKPEALQRAADAFLAEGGDDDDLLGEAPFRESFRPGAARDFRADRLARARYAARMARARAHLGEARSGDATLVSQWLDLKYEGEAADEWKEKERERFLAAESSQDDDDDDDDDDLNPDARAPSSSHHDYYDEESGLRIDSGGVPAAATHAQRAERLRRARVAARLSRARAKKGEATGADGAAIKQYIDLRWEEERGSGAPRAAWKASAQAQFLSLIHI